MIAYIIGKVHSYGLDYVILENNGIGYRIAFMHPETVSLNKEIMLYTYHHVREDEISLYGFVSNDEYELFMRLIQVKGLGPKTALNVLGAISAEKLIQTIEKSDIASLRRLPGIGPKTAAQIILDLKGKLVRELREDMEMSAEFSDAIAALKALGYKSGELQAISKELGDRTDLTTEEYVRIGLQLLLKKRGG